MKTIEVVAAVILKDNQVLTTQRGYGNLQGRWEFPGGKIAQTNNYVNGKKEGELIEYYESGKIKEKRFYINDKEEGKSLFYDEKGNLTKTEIYKNGVKQ